MLNNKNKTFVQHYLATGNAPESALAAGYKSGTYGYELLKKKAIQDYIASCTVSKKIANADEVLSFLTSVMRGEQWEIKVTVSKETGEKLLLGEPPSLSQRQKAAELLAKRYQLFNEKPAESQNDSEFVVNIKVVD